MGDSDLIYRGRLIYELYKYCLKHEIEPEIFMMCKKIIEKPEAINAVVAIRCIDCKFATDKQPFTCICDLSKNRMCLDGFCSEGIAGEDIAKSKGRDNK